MEDPIERLFSELSLALRWGRPLILVVVCSSAPVRKHAQQALKPLLMNVGQKVVNFAISPLNYDVPLVISRHPDRKSTVFFVTGINRGGGGDRANAFRALNIRRELLVDQSVRVIFWLTKAEAKSLPRLAPDFWAFRHTVIEI